MMTFDLVLPAILRTCEMAPGFATFERACVVRDLRGRVRLVLAPHAGESTRDVETHVSTLEHALQVELGGYFAGPILTTTGHVDSARLAREVLDASRPWKDAGYDDPATGQYVAALPGRWQLLERRLSKQSWLEPAPPKPLWPLVKGAPPIVTFYSFKGGVGRTTALVSCAWQLAREGKRVAVLDLDLEAPGLGALLGSGADRGVLDAIVDHVASNSIDIDGLHSSAQAIGAEDAKNLDIITAGRLGVSYLEKLARLDFVASGPWTDEEQSPVESALRELLRSVKAKLKPDLIFLDARAGLHDLAGLSLHGLAHVDVLVTRASEQAYQGFDLTLHALSIRKNAADLRCVVVHSFAPPKSSPVLRDAEREEVAQRVYESFDRHIYPAYTENAPALEDATAAHFPWIISQDPDLERFPAIETVKENLFSEEYGALRRRIEELCSPEVPDDEEGN
jgi:MinD-like ATPase involved in chromosome partitioning or flagellar assembly